MIICNQCLTELEDKGGQYRFNKQVPYEDWCTQCGKLQLFPTNITITKTIEEAQNEEEF